MVGVKPLESLTAKVDRRTAADPGWNAGEAVEAITDLNRYALSFPPGRYATGVADAVAWLRRRGWTLLRWRNRWSDPAFMGISSLWQPPQPEPDQTLEVEFHTETGWSIRTGPAMPLYQSYIDLQTSAAQRVDIERRLRQLRNRIATPQHAEKIWFQPFAPVWPVAPILTDDRHYYFAVVDGKRYHTRRPLAVVRRSISQAGTRHDHETSRGYPWQPGRFLIEAEHGDCQFDFIPLTRQEADQLTAMLETTRQQTPQPALGTHPAAST